MKLVWKSYVEICCRRNGQLQKTISFLSLRAYIPWILCLLRAIVQATGDFTSSLALYAALPLCNLRLLYFSSLFLTWLPAFPFLGSCGMIIGRLWFQLKCHHPHRCKPMLTIATRKFSFNNMLEPRQLLLGILNRSTRDCSFKFCQRYWAQWIDQGYSKCVCQSLLQGRIGSVTHTIKMLNETFSQGFPMKSPMYLILQ